MRWWWYPARDAAFARSNASGDCGEYGVGDEYGGGEYETGDATNGGAPAALYAAAAAASAAAAGDHDPGGATG